MSRYPECPPSGPVGAHGGYSSQVGNMDPFSSPFGSQAWAATPMMNSANTYPGAGSVQLSQEQGGHQGYGTASNALVPAGGYGSALGGQATDSLSRDLMVPSQALVQFPDSPFADNIAAVPMATDGVVKIGNVSECDFSCGCWLH